MTTTSNMGLSQPTPGSSGPEWANELNANATLIDEHDHSSGKGVPITPSGININTDFTTNSNKVIDVKSVKFVSQAASLVDTNALDVYIKNGDLFYANGLTDVQITNGGSVAGANGTITGLASPASASFAGQQFSFFYDAGTYADLRARDVILSTNGGGGFTIKLTHTATSSYVLSLPPAPPSTNSQMMTMATSGQVSASTSPTLGNTSSVLTWQGTTIASSPTAAAFVVSGGIGCQSLYSQGFIATNSSLTVGNVLSVTSGGASITGGCAVTGAITATSTLDTTGVRTDTSYMKWKTIITNMTPSGGLNYTHGLTQSKIWNAAVWIVDGTTGTYLEYGAYTSSLGQLLITSTAITSSGNLIVLANLSVRILITYTL